MTFAEELEEVFIQDKSVESEAVNEDNMSFDSINSEQLKDSQAESMDDIFQQTSSVTTTGGPRSNSEAPQIRGLDAKKIFIYVDGVKQSFRTDHSTMIPLNLDLIKAVEIYKSPFSNISKTSLGGGVQFVTKDPSDFFSDNKKRGLNINLGTQDANFSKKSALTFFNQAKKWDYFVYSGYTDADDVSLSDGSTLPNSAYRDQNITSKLVYNKNKNTKYKLTVDYFKRDDTVPINPTLNPPTDIDSLNGTNINTRQLFKLEYVFGKRNFTLYHNKQEQLKERNGDGEKESRIVKTYGTSFNYHKKLKYKIDVYTGIESVKDELDGKRSNADLESYPTGTSQLHSAYTHVEKEVTNELKLMLGSRLDDYTLDGINSDVAQNHSSYVSNKFGVSLNTSKNTTLSLQQSQGFNAPRVQDIYIDGLHSSGDGFIFRDNYFIPNEKLKPETSLVSEISFSYQDNLFSIEDFLSFKIQFHESRIKNYILTERIDRSVIDDEDGTTQFVNIPKAITAGVDLMLEYIYLDNEIKITYSKIRGKNLTEDLNIQDMPADQYDLFLTKLFGSDLKVGIHFLWAQEQNRTNPETTQRTEKTEEYLIYNAFISKEFKNGLSLATRVENISGKEYRRHGSFLKEKARDLKININYKYYF